MQLLERLFSNSKLYIVIFFYFRMAYHHSRLDCGLVQEINSLRRIQPFWSLRHVVQNGRMRGCCFFFSTGRATGRAGSLVNGTESVFSSHAFLSFFASDRCQYNPRRLETRVEEGDRIQRPEVHYLTFCGRPREWHCASLHGGRQVDRHLCHRTTTTGKRHIALHLNRVTCSQISMVPWKSRGVDQSLTEVLFLEYKYVYNLN